MPSRLQCLAPNGPAMPYSFARMACFSQSAISLPKPNRSGSPASTGRSSPGIPSPSTTPPVSGCVLPLGQLALPPLPRGSASAVTTGSRVFAISHGGLGHALETRIIAKREFAGYWEYVLDEALFTAPAHPHWSGAALLDESGRLLGIGSLLVQEQQSEKIEANMFVPIDLLEPILDEMSTTGRPSRAPRPWLGIYTMEMQGHLVVSGLADQGPAARAGVRPGDLILQVAGEPVSGLADLFRSIWRLGPVGTDVPLTLARGSAQPLVRVRSADRNDYLRKPAQH